MVVFAVFCLSVVELSQPRSKYKADSPHRAADVHYLLLSHVNSSDMALLAHQLTQHVAVSPTPTAQVQYPTALQALRHHQTTAIVPEKKDARCQYEYTGSSTT